MRARKPSTRNFLHGVSSCCIPPGGEVATLTVSCLLAGGQCCYASESIGPALVGPKCSHSVSAQTSSRLGTSGNLPYRHRGPPVLATEVERKNTGLTLVSGDKPGRRQNVKKTSCLLCLALQHRTHNLVGKMPQILNVQITSSKTGNRPEALKHHQ